MRPQPPGQSQCHLTLNTLCLFSFPLKSHWALLPRGRLAPYRPTAHLLFFFFFFIFISGCIRSSLLHVGFP